MFTQLQHFQNNEFGSLEILIIDDKPYFPATACAKILGYTTPEKAIRMHCKGVSKMGTPTNGGNQNVNYIPEGDLYRLIIRSKLPAAERFERWVFDEVLPSIRKYGAYMIDDILDTAEKSQEFAFELIRKLQAEKGKTAALQGKVEALEPKARYCDLILQCKGVVQVSVIAKDYGMTAVALNKLLHELGVQFKIGNTWLLYQRHANRGYTRSRTYHTPGGSFVIHTYWTQKGRLFLYELLKSYGIVPLIDVGYTS